MMRALELLIGSGRRGMCLSLFLGSLICGQTAPSFSTPRRLTNGEFAFLLSAPTGALCRVDASTNLADWNGFLTLQSVGMNQQTDTAAPYLRERFYRAEQLAQTNLLTGDHLPTTSGDVVLHSLNHATLVLSWNGKMIYVDPVGGSTPFQSFPRADLTLVTHSHSDHYHAVTLSAVRASNGLVVAPRAVYDAMSIALRTNTILLTNGMTTNVSGMNVEATPAYNLTTTYHPRGVGNGYVLTLGGRRLYFSGDTEDIPEMRALPQIDVAFVCMNIPFTMTVDRAASAVREFRPRVVYPYHFRNQNSTFADLSDFKRRVGADLGIEVRFRTWY